MVFLVDVINWVGRIGIVVVIIDYVYVMCFGDCGEQYIIGWQVDCWCVQGCYGDVCIWEGKISV